jgi:predicted 3-demethylubiquinone-9 3-methyltransferase (glyoxalase superfamily)
MAYKLTEKAPTESGYYWAKSKWGILMMIEVDEIGTIMHNGHKISSPTILVAWSERIEEPEE